MQDINCMNVEALMGSKESCDPFFAQIRSHPGQVEAAHSIFPFLPGQYEQSLEIVA